MYNYVNLKEEEFFENNRFNNENLPSNKDLAFLNGTGILEKLNIKLDVSDKRIAIKDWEKLKTVLYFNDTNSKIETLREPAAINCKEFIKNILNGKIIPFERYQDEDGKNLIQKMKDINVSTYSSMYEYFVRGEHIGRCGITSKLYGIAFENPIYHIGQCISLIGTKGCTKDNPSHAWLEVKLNGKEYIIDTSLLVIVPIELKENLGYKDIKKPFSKKELMEYADENDTFYEHYNILNKKSTVNKASYYTYIEEIKRIKEVEKEER